MLDERAHQRNASGNDDSSTELPFQLHNFIRDDTIQNGRVAPLRIREGDTLCAVGRPERELQVLSIERKKGDVLEIELSVISKKREYRDGRGRKQPAANNKAFVGEELMLVPVSMDQISRGKNKKIWSRNVPGFWMTHANPEELRTSSASTQTRDDADNLFERLGRL